MERIMDEGADHSERYVKKYQYNKKMAYDTTSKTTVKSNNERISFYASAYVWSPKHFFPNYN